MRKRILSTLLVVCMVLGMLPCEAKAVEASGDCGLGVTWTLNDEGIMTISGSGKMEFNLPVPWNDYKNDIKSVIIESGVTNIAAYAFKGCANLATVTILGRIDTIGSNAFANCHKMVSAPITDGLTTIGSEAFYKCSQLTEVYIPETVTSIGSRAFNACYDLRSIKVAANSASFCDQDGVLFDKSGTKLIFYPAGKPAAPYDIPNGVTEIARYAFEDSRIIDVTIPDSVTTIGIGAFSASSRLTHVTLPSGITSIPPQLFEACSNLTSINIPEGVNSIGALAFWECYHLRWIVLPASIATIGYSAFLGVGELYFNGDAPYLDLEALHSRPPFSDDAKVYYVAGTSGWTSDFWAKYIAGTWSGGSEPPISEPTYRIIYKLNSGKGDFPTVEGQYPNTIYNIPSVTPTRNNCNFFGWEKDGGPETYKAGRFFVMPSHDVVLKAVWVDNRGSIVPGVDDGAEPDPEPDPGPDPNPPTPGDGRIVSLFPENGATDVGYDASNPPEFRITFDREINTPDGDGRADVDLTADGAFAIYRASDDALIWKPNQYSGSNFAVVYGDKNTLVVKSTNRHAMLEPDTQYYVTMGEGFVRFADGTGSPAIQKGEWRFTTIPNNTVTFHYASSLGGDAIYSGLSYRDSWFFGDSDKYNHDLAKMSLGLAMSGFGSNKNLNYKDINVRNLFYELYFDTDTYYSAGYESEDNNTVALAMCQKEIFNGNSDKATLLAVCLRGAGYGDGGWVGNVNVGDVSTSGPYHEGFYRAARDAYAKIAKYISDNSIDKTKLRIWITGFSRSAAIANLLSAQLRINGLCSGPNIYTYTFATPNNQQITVDNSTYNNIFNIINPNDIVPTVPLAQWKFGKMGTSYLLPSMTENGMKTQYFRQVQASFNSLTNNSVTYETFAYIAPTLAWLNYTVGKAIPTRAEYNVFLETALEKLVAGDPSAFDGFFYGITTIEEIVSLIEGNHYIKLAGLLKDVIDVTSASSPVFPLVSALYDVVKGTGLEYLNPDRGTANIGIIMALCQIYKHGTSAPLLQEHWPEIYFSWINCINEDDLSKTEKFKFKIGIVSCPVDINVYDTKGVLVAQVIDDIVHEVEGSSVIAVVLGESNKVFSFPDDQVYQIEITATDTGYMNYSVLENSSDGTLVRTVEFHDIELTTGDRFSGYIDNELYSESQNYALTENEEIVIYPDYDSYTPSIVPPEPTPFYPSSSSSSSSFTPTTYSITAPVISSGGTITIIPTSASKGTTVTLITIPDAGYELASLTVTDGRGNVLELVDNGNGTYTFTMPDSAVTVDAIFKLIKQPSTPSGWINPFTDVAVTAWYYDAVRFVSNNGLMNGLSSTIFAPEANLTRAQLAQILYNKEGRPVVSGSNTFTDVDAGAWYSDAVIWAAANNIVTGYGNGRFGPNDNITREQLAVMLWRYAGEPTCSNDLAFSDAGQISDFARDAIRWAVENKILNGKGNNILDPKGFATRAETAQMLKNYFG